jgi:hypothetical protein
MSIDLGFKGVGSVSSASQIRASARVIIIIIIIIIIPGIFFMQDIYTYIPETNHIRMEH